MGSLSWWKAWGLKKNLGVLNEHLMVQQWKYSGLQWDGFQGLWWKLGSPMRSLQGLSFFGLQWGTSGVCDDKLGSPMKSLGSLMISLCLQWGAMKSSLKNLGFTMILWNALGLLQKSGGLTINMCVRVSDIKKKILEK